MYLLLFVGIFTGCVADNDFIDCGATSSKDESQQTQVMLVKGQSLRVVFLSKMTLKSTILYYGHLMAKEIMLAFYMGLKIQIRMKKATVS